MDVAENLGITKPSVHAMMNTFISLGLIKKDRYGTAFFSDEGWRLVETYSRYYELIWERLRPLNFSGDEARSAACAVLAEISTEGLELMADIAGNRVYQREGVNVVS